ncbi:hypothetical protein [Brachyspira intermedia]|uniref:hypothetical protein n=1 Tax=Brachyspira intermedia TaxID=84377 RepID=UPI003006DBBF
MKKQIKILSIFAIIMLLSVSCAKDNPSNPSNNNNNNNDNIGDTTNWKDRANYKLLQQIWQGNSGIFQYKDAENVYQGSLILYGGVYGGNMKYTMAIEAIAWISETEGIMYGKYTFNMTDFTLTGKYYAIAFKNLTESSVDLCEASLANKKYAETLEDAEKSFTIASGAFGTYNKYTVYNKQ